MSFFQVLHRYLVLLLLFFSTFNGMSASTIDRTIAKLNDDILTESDLVEVVADLNGDFNPLQRSGYENASSDTVKAMFDRALLLQEAKRRKITPKSEELHRQVEGMVRDIRANFSSESEFYHALAAERMSLDQLKQELLEKTETDFMVYHVVSSQFSVSDEEVTRYQQELKLAGDTAVSFRLRRLGIPVKKETDPAAACREARALVARIITEGISFEEGVRRYSQVPGAAADAGDMGYMAADKLSADVRKAVEPLEVGQASVPVIAGGYANIFYVEGKRGAHSELREKRFFEARKQLLDDLRRKAILQVFDERLKKIMPAEYLDALVDSPSPGKVKASGGEQTESAAGEQYRRHSSPPPLSEQQQQQRPADPQSPQYVPQPQTHPQPTPQPRRFPWFGRQQ